MFEEKVTKGGFAMIRKPRSFSLTESGFKALRSCQKSYPHLGRGKLVSVALENMDRQVEASRRAQFRLPDTEEWNRISQILAEIEIFHEDISAALDFPPLSCDPSESKEIKEKILFEADELSRLRARVCKLTPLAGDLRSQDRENLENFIEIAKRKHCDKATAAAFGIAIKLLEPLL